MFRWVGYLFLVCLSLILGGHLASMRVDGGLNLVSGGHENVPPPPADMRIADLHADMLLWDRDHRARETRGQTDLVRLREGGVDLQLFSAVTASPRGQNFDQNTIETGDNITRLALAQGWPLATLVSMRARAVHQAERLRGLARIGELTIVRTADDLDAPGLKGILAIEGAHALDGELANIDHLYDAGYRVMGLQHFFDNALGGSMHGISQGGLTEFGRAAVTRMVERGIIIDLAHSSEAVARDVLALTDAPVIVSHTGLRSACPSTANRNLPDEIMREIADRGGLIGIAYFEGAVCDIRPDALARHIALSIETLGVDAVSLGSDFDGSVVTDFDASQLSLLSDALARQGLDERTIRQVMGENAFRFFRDNLPREN